MSLYVQTNQVITLSTATPLTISTADTGKFILVPGQAGAQIINLPALAPGLTYRFIKTGIAAAGSSAITPITAVIQGQTNSAATFAAAVNGASVTFAAASSMGDMVEMYCDGVNWNIKGNSKTALGMSVP